MPRITAPFTITAQEPAEQTPWGGPGSGVGASSAPLLGRTTLRKTYAGPLDGTAVVEMLTCVADPADMSRGAVYTAIEQVTGRLDGLEGTFVIQHGAAMSAGAPPSAPTGAIAPGSGTGALAGLRGTVEIHRGPDGSHSLLLNYDLA